MAIPRIIIADPDYNYIVPLQQKFVTEFFEKAEIEIITNRQYFTELFTMPQRADILIVAEAFYDESLQRHNIGNIFLLTEQSGVGSTEDLNIVRIFKYTSIRAILDQIIAKSAGVLKIDFTEKKEAQILLVYSACGGTGKTTVALGMAECLAKNYKHVLYLNAEHLQTFQQALKNRSPITAADVYASLANPDDSTYHNISHVIRKEDFDYLPPFKAALMSLGIPYSVFGKIALGAKNSANYDYIIIDTDSTFDEEKADLFGLADRVMIVTTQGAASVYATNILMSNVAGANSEKYLFVCNNFNKDEDNALISSEFRANFTVSEYVEHFKQYDRMDCRKIAEDGGIQKVAFLVL